MLTLDELSSKISAYGNGQISFDEFEDWFEDNSIGAYAVPELKSACAAVESALAEYYFDHISQDQLRDALALIHPYGLELIAVAENSNKDNDSQKPISQNNSESEFIKFSSASASRLLSPRFGHL